MRTVLVVMPALVLAGAALAQDGGRPDPRDPRAKAPPVGHRSALEGYRPYAEPQLRDWRRSNAEVAGARGHSGHQSGHGPQAPGHGSLR